MTSSSIAYHEGELRVALDRANPLRLVPEPGDARAILDIGCGAGQTIVALGAAARSVGVDFDVDALEFGVRRSGDALRLVAATGERLPFTDAAFDYVYSRVAIPYMNIPRAVAEMRRVLRPGGRLWLALHSIEIPAEQLRRGNVKGKVYAAYTIVNGVWFHFTGRTFRLTTRICESIQTERGMRKALERAGFSGIHFQRSRHHFVVTAES